MKEIVDLLESGIKQNHFPGVSYAIVNRDGIISSNHLGYQQTYPTKIPVNGNEIYDCASLTKVVSTTTMIMKLIDMGKLTLDTKISSILPMFRYQEITIKHCLTHTSGLPADIPKANTLQTKEDVLNKVYSFDLINPVGEKIVYSDIGFILLGQVIETITKKPLSTFAKEVIFQPLKMNDTSYHPDPSRCAPTEYRDDNVYQGLLKGRVHDEKSFALHHESGHAGMFSTVYDLSKFIQMILRNDGAILKQETINQLFPLQREDISPKGNRLVRSLGWDKPTPGGTAGDNVSFEDTIVHTGFTGCNLWIDRSKNLGFVMLSNAVHPKRERNNILRYRNKIGNIIIPKEEHS